MALTAGTKLGPYEVIGPIGAGGMGEVYRARDTRLGREVALKVLPTSFAKDAERLRRFEQEARTVAALNHPNILAVYDVGEFDGAPYLVSELLEGQTLRARMSEGALPQRRAIEYASQIADGLAAAHEKDVVHRDLKPENVFVMKDGRVKILDFGLAKLAKAQQASAGAADITAAGPTQTTPGMVLGTAGYMSPEQVRAKDVDARTDIFALGSILYEMLSGQRAFRGDTSVETMNAILKEDPPELETDKLHVSPGVERIVRRCLEKERERRFQSARDLGFALEAISGSHVTVAERSPIKAAKPRVAKIAVVVGLLAVAAGAYWMGSRGGAGEKVAEDQFQLMTFRPQIIFRAAFAPDGKTVIFSSAHWANRPDIFVLSPEYPEPRPTELKNTQLLAVSSKGDLAVLTQPRFLGHRIFQGTLARVPIGGSAPRAIVDGVMEADWSPDGSELAITRVVGSRCRLEYPVGKVLAETNGYFSDVRVSPQGDRIAFFEHDFRYDDRGTVAVVDLSGNKKMLSEMFWGAEGLAWSPDGKEILYSAGKGSYSSFPVRAVTLDGHTRIVQDSAGGLWIMDVSRDGRWLALQESQWREMAGIGPGAKAETDLSFLDFSIPVAMSADGKTLLFTEENSFFGKNYSVLIRRTDGSPAVQIGEGQAEDLSPDGTMALAIVMTSPDKLVVYPTGAGAPQQLNTGKVNHLQNAKWFPDGKTVVMCGSEPGHSARCYAVALTGGEPTAITPEGTTNGVPTPDGKEVLALNADGTRSLYPVTGGSPRLVLALEKQKQVWFDDLLGWTADGKGLIMRVPETEAAVTLQRIDLETGKRTVLRRLAPADPLGLLAIQNIVVAEDAKYYAYAYRREKSSLFLVNRPK